MEGLHYVLGIKGGRPPVAIYKKFTRCRAIVKITGIVGVWG